MKDEQNKPTPIVSLASQSGGLVEMLYDEERGETALCCAAGSAWSVERSVERDGRRLVPYSPHNNLLKNQVVLLPSEPEEYDTVDRLLREIRGFIHRNVDVSAVFEEIAAHYVLLTWVYDRFPAVPYLRVRGDPGSGKTRFLTVVGSLCYKPIFASGASTVSPLFRMLDTFRGTLVLDESDFNQSDERSEIVKILNNGHAQGFPVLRTESNGQREFNPHAYAVFGPKIIATRGMFQDAALESRCLTEEMGHTEVRTDVPVGLPSEFRLDAKRLRNKLLFYRLSCLDAPLQPIGHLTEALEPRLRQIIEPLLGLVADPIARVRIAEYAEGLQKQMISDRGMEIEARLLEVVRDIRAELGWASLSVKNITQRFSERFGDDYERRITTRWIGGLIRGTLHLRTQKTNGVYIIPEAEKPKMDRMFERYGVD